MVWTCCKCKERFKITLSVFHSEEYSIEGQRACKLCVKKYSLRIPKFTRNFSGLENAQELGLKHETICGDDFLGFDTECESYVDKVSYGNNVFEKRDLEIKK